MTLAERILKAQKAATERVKGLPSRRPMVKSIKLAPYTDAEGESALCVVVILEEGTRPSDRNYFKLDPIEEQIRQAIQTEDISLWPYFWFRTPSEQRQAKQAAA
jgi:hypothetical protein